MTATLIDTPSSESGAAVPIGSTPDGAELLSSRKDAHLDLCLNRDVGSSASTGLGGYTFEYDALPEIDLDAVDLSVELFGKKLTAPIIVGAMTGGTPRAGEVNRRLARAA
ncbi:hypothetical protein JYT28_01680, partial [Desulfobulbus sp. AH-315-M07]|nr:hypothetical protein [Desulfobulbus sp. AH-315-M07]